MKILNDVSLATYTTIKIGGIAKKLYVPENVSELAEIVTEIMPEPLYIISGGSNLLINDNCVFDKVISMREVDSSMELLSDGCFYCGASVRIQKFIQFAKEREYGGIEYLYSLPAYMGGIIFMNAGRGEKQNCCIGNHIEEVYALYQGTPIAVSKEQCNFAYRSSIFQNGKYIITGCKLRLENKNKAEVDKDIKARLDLCKRTQDHSGATIGSVFAACDPFVMRICRKIDSLRTKRGGVRWSSRRGNWFVNLGAGTFEEAYGRISRCKLLHKLLRKKCTVEVRVWK